MGDAKPGAVSVTGGALHVREPRLPKLPPMPKRASAVPAKRTSATTNTAATTCDLVSTLRRPSRGRVRPRIGTANDVVRAARLVIGKSERRVGMRQVLPLSVIPAKAGIHCSIAPNFLDF